MEIKLEDLNKKETERVVEGYLKNEHEQIVWYLKKIEKYLENPSIFTLQFQRYMVGFVNLIGNPAERKILNETKDLGKAYMIFNGLKGAVARLGRLGISTEMYDDALFSIKKRDEWERELNTRMQDLYFEE